MKKKKIILTKNRLRALDVALSMDDILYEKMRRMEERTQIMLRKWKRENQVYAVIQEKDKNSYNLQIMKEVRTSAGIIVYVK